MPTYGCWDCGSEIPPHHGHCAVCGWPAPPPRRRRRLPAILLLGFLAGVVAVGAVFAGANASVPYKSQARIAKRQHRFVMPTQYGQKSAICGNVFRCQNCGVLEMSDRRPRECPGPKVKRR